MSTAASFDLQNNIYWESLRSFLAPINPLLDDPKVSEVMINGDKIFYEQGGSLHSTDIQIEEAKLLAAVRNLAQFVGKELTEDSLSLAARLPDGSRVQVMLPPSSHTGICFAIRKFSKKMLALEDLVNWGALSEKGAEWLKIVVKMKKNTLISGGTGSGKTTLLNILGSMVPDGERILIMEDVCELQIEHDHLVSLETRQPTGNPPRGGVSMRELVMIALRMRPDRVIVGEVRGGEAMDLLQAMSTGHSGSMGTVHANDPQGALRRMETLATYAGGEIPLSAIRSQVTSSLEVIVQINRFGDGSRRLTHISEVLPLDLQGNYQTRDIFRFNLKGKNEEGKLLGELEPTGEESLFLSQIPLFGIDLDKSIFEK